MGSITRTIKGKLKKTEGQITGDKVREVQGTVEETAGSIGTKVKSKVAKVKAKAKVAKAKAKAKLGIAKAKAKAGVAAAKTKAGRKAAAAKMMP